MTADARIAKLRALPLTEEAWVRRIIDTARAYEWCVCAYRPARTEKGWRTPVLGDAGGPDLTLARKGVVLLWEAKRDDGSIQSNQRRWIENGVTVVRPRDWDTYVLPTLKGETS